MLVAILAILLLLWAFGFLFLWRVPVPQGPLRQAGSSARQRSSEPKISVIIPARNEEHSLPRLLASLRAQSLRPAEIIVVDDHSEDRTAELAGEAGTKVIRAEPLPQGWLGKPWACWQGARAAGGETLIFLDADTTLEPGGLERILASHVQDRGLLSVWPYHRMVRLYERLSALFNVVILASIRCFTVWGRRLKPLGAFGPCVVCRRRDYFAAGGHEAVRGAILEDVALGQAFQRAGFEVHNYGGRGAISFRMYPAGLGSLVDGFGKNLGSGARDASPAVLLPMIGWIAGCFIVASWLLYRLAADAPTWVSVLPWALLYLLYALQIFWMLQRLGNYGAFTALLYPAPLLFFAAVFLVSLLRTFLVRRVRWKGREIRTGGG